MNGRSAWVRTALLGAMILGGIAFGAAQAATLNVNTFSDETTPSDTQCSLREAVAAINGGADSADCVNTVPDTEPYGTNDTIVLPAGAYALTLAQPATTPPQYGEYAVTATGSEGNVTGYSVSVTPDNAVGDLDIGKSVTIVGAEPGAAIQAGAGFNDRILHIYADTGTVNVALKDVIIQGGVSPLNGTEVGQDSSGNPWALRLQGGGIATGAGAVAYNTTATGQGAESGGGGQGGPGGPGGGEESGATYGLALDNVSVLNNAAGDGGGLYSTANLSAYETTIAGNTATANGGGLYNDAAMVCLACTLDGNHAEGGGGFFDTGQHDTLVAGSTISRNTAVGGGGISSRSQVNLTLVGSTVSGNQAQDTGGGIYTNGTVKLYFVTVADNFVSGETGETGETGVSPSAVDGDTGTGAGGAGVNTFASGEVLLSNTLLANNLVGATLANCGGTGGAPASVIDAGYNLDSGTSCQLSAGGDLSMVDPLIGPLADNGGATQTHQLLPGSPAVNAGGSPGVTFTVMGATFDPAAVDQRGIARNDTPDIGAYEVPSVPSTDDGGSGGTAVTTSSSGGGCALAPSTGFDPTLSGLVLTAFGALAWRRARRGRR